MEAYVDRLPVLIVSMQSFRFTEVIANKTHLLTSLPSEMSVNRSRTFAFKIYSRFASQALEVACETDADMKDWVEKISQCSSTAVQRVSLNLRSRFVRTMSCLLTFFYFQVPDLSTSQMIVVQYFEYDIANSTIMLNIDLV